jgi:ribose/xylose/arabinose/galactoside ABC-type transport system permease subunit
MSYVLYGVIFMSKTLLITQVPVALVALIWSPLPLVLWILLVLGCAALMIFTPLGGRRPQAGEPGQVSLGWKERLYKGLPFLFASLMAWISGVLLLDSAGYVGVASGPHFAGIAIAATLLGGTAYQAGTGFVLSGAIALIDIVLLQQVLHLSTAEERIILGALMVIMLLIAQYYHVGIDRLYSQQSKKEEDASSGAAPQP